MTRDELQAQLQTLIAHWEDECVEFKEANDNYSTADIGKYFSALSNEANLRRRTSGWLVLASGTGIAPSWARSIARIGSGSTA